MQRGYPTDSRIPVPWYCFGCTAFFCFLGAAQGLADWGSSRPSRGERARLHTSQRPLAVGPIQIPNGVGRHGDRQ